MILSRVCLVCEQTFSPKPGGYNALYCGHSCRRKAASNRLAREKRRQKPEVRAVINRQDAAGKKAVRDWLSAYKVANGCVDCGYNAFACALQLDHEGEKSVPISEARSSLARLKAEITNGRCVVRCANCHAVKTWQRKIGLTTGL